MTKRGFNYDCTCDWCTENVDEREYQENGGLCDSCVKYIKNNSKLIDKKDDTKTVHMCQNYLVCGKESVCHGDYGYMCLDCWMKEVQKDRSGKEGKTGVKKVILSKKEQKRNQDSIINGLRSVLSIK